MLDPIMLAVISNQINQITTAAECNQIITDFSKTKSDFDFAALSEERKITRLDVIVQNIDSGIGAAQAEKASYLPVVAGLPVGNEVRVSLERKVVALDFRLFNLENRRENFGKIAVLAARLKYASALANAANYDQVLTLVQAKRATL